jgi:FMN phosphatase YigB (HAD superfamily)
MTAPFAGNWDAIRLIVFDLDGTLYDQRPLRRRMAFELARDALANRHTTTLRVLAKYRKLREEWAGRDLIDFEGELREAVAGASSATPDEVAALVSEWIETRPLRHLRRYRFAQLAELFAGIRGSGRTIAVHSDYPVAAKLAALGLEADHIACAGDANGVRLKPDPSGLLWLMERVGVAPHETMMIGDRFEHDGVAAQRAGTACLIKSRRPIPGANTFRHFDDALFAPLLG